MADVVELSSEQKFIQFKLQRPQDFNAKIRDTPLVLGAAVTEVPGEVRAKYHRDKDESETWADVWVSGGQDELAFDAIVTVRIRYRGDMVRSTPRQREQINHRLTELAQAACLEQLRREVMPNRAIGYAKIEEPPTNRREEK